MKKFADRLSELRHRKGLTQEALAKAVGSTRSAIANYEQGTREPNFELLDAFADFFNVDVDFLLGGERTTRILTSNQEKLISIMETLNSAGEYQLIDYAQFLATNPRLKKIIEVNDEQCDLLMSV